jgi:hypothetical protein
VGRWQTKQVPLGPGFLVDRGRDGDGAREAVPRSPKRQRLLSLPALVSPPQPPGLTRWIIEGGREAVHAPRAAAACGVGALAEPLRDVERRKAVRAEMLAHECVECARFYDAMEYAAGDERRKGACGHAGKVTREEQRAAAGRHRSNWQPALTPNGFWNLGFDPTVWRTAIVSLPLY